LAPNDSHKNYMPSHSHDRFDFRDLSPQQQAAAITAMTNNLGNAIAYRIRHPGRSSAAIIRTKAVRQLENLIDRIRAL